MVLSHIDGRIVTLIILSIYRWLPPWTQFTCQSGVGRV